ncbi:hypothetical protein FZ046_15060 [Mycolicibacterium grossiae]|nr:hypothetical protein FZ046_15060 [Mycolicibacterium grossiae]
MAPAEAIRAAGSIPRRCSSTTSGCGDAVARQPPGGGGGGGRMSPGGGGGAPSSGAGGRYSTNPGEITVPGGGAVPGNG